MAERSFPPVESRNGMTAAGLADGLKGLDRPVVFRGAVADWPAVTAAQTSPEALIAYLKACDNGRPCAAFRQGAGDGRFFYGETGGFNFQRAEVPLGMTLDRLDRLRGAATGEHIYIQSAPLKDHMPRFKADNSLPGIAAEPRVWIGNRSITQIHFDLYDNLVCMVAGRKRFVIFPPEQTANLYMGPVETTVSGVPTGMANLENPDFVAHPRFGLALDAAAEAVLEPGDILFIPYMWWHHVVSTDDLNVQVNYWWNPAGPEMGQAMHVLILAMLNLRDLPAQQKTAWRAMFDHLVFGEADADHLPPDQRGILGGLTPEQRSHIRRQLGQNLQDRT